MFKTGFLHIVLNLDRYYIFGLFVSQDTVSTNKKQMVTCVSMIFNIAHSPPPPTTLKK